MPENVYIGRKPVLNYVTAIVTALQKDPTVHVLARGRAISSAVDVIEVSKRSFVTDMIIEEINIGTEEMGSENEKRNVSTIQIVVKKPS